jgi:hypothetical protein
MHAEARSVANESKAGRSQSTHILIREYGAAVRDAVVIPGAIARSDSLPRVASVRPGRGDACGHGLRDSLSRHLILRHPGANADRARGRCHRALSPRQLGASFCQPAVCGRFWPADPSARATVRLCRHMGVRASPWRLVVVGIACGKSRHANAKNATGLPKTKPCPLARVSREYGPK